MKLNQKIRITIISPCWLISFINTYGLLILSTHSIKFYLKSILWTIWIKYLYKILISVGFYNSSCVYNTHSIWMCNILTMSCCPNCSLPRLSSVGLRDNNRRNNSKNLITIIIITTIILVTNYSNTSRWSWNIWNCKGSLSIRKTVVYT